jgi:cytochrome c553
VHFVGLHQRFVITSLLFRRRLALFPLKFDNMKVKRSFKLIVILFFVALAACSGREISRYSIKDSKSLEASLFRQNCAICHGPEGEGKTLSDGRIIPNIRDGEHKYSTREQIYDHITNGGKGMVPFRDILTEKERNSLVEFVLNDLRKKEN